MDDRLTFGFGFGFVSLFVRWVFPTVPKPIAVTGLISGMTLTILSLASATHLGPAILIALGVGAIGGGIAWQHQLSHNALEPTAGTAGASADALSKAAPRAQPSSSIRPDSTSATALKSIDDHAHHARVAEQTGSVPQHNNRIGDNNTVVGSTPIDSMGSNNTIVGATDDRRNAIFNGGTSIGKDAGFSPNGVIIGSGAGRNLRNRSDSEDEQRQQILRQVTQLYIHRHDGITPRMMAGMELPPADFVNGELEHQGLSWRVEIDPKGRFAFIDAPGR